MSWIAVSRTATITAKPKKILLNETPMVTFRDKFNKIVVVPGRCVHRGMDLSHGKVVEGGSCLECPYHGWRYDQGGYRKPFSNAREERGLPLIFREQDDLLWAAPRDARDKGEMQPPPSLPDLDATHRVWFETVIDQNAQVILENGIDPTHASYVHANPLGFGVYKQAPKGMQYDKKAMSFWYKPNQNTLLARILDVRDAYNVHGIEFPYTTWSRVHIRDHVLVTFVTLLPETPDRTRMFVGFSRTFLKHPAFDPMIEIMGRTIVEQDRFILERIDKDLNARGVLDPEYDGLVATYREGLDKCDFR